MNAVALESEASERDRKHWATLTARAALAGLQLLRTNPDDGPERFVVVRSGVGRVFADLGEVDRVLDVLGGAA